MSQSRTIALLRAMAPVEGYSLTALPGVRILRSDRALARTPVLYDPGIVIVCQGRKRGYFGDQLYVYDAQHYLAVSVPVPFTMETDATPPHPLLALYLHLDFALAAELMLHIDRHPGPDPVQPPQSMMASPMDAAMRASFCACSKPCTGPWMPRCWAHPCCANCISACSPAHKGARCAKPWH
jgi:hypothetical protein